MAYLYLGRDSTKMGACVVSSTYPYNSAKGIIPDINATLAHFHEWASPRYSFSLGQTPLSPLVATAHNILAKELCRKR